MWLYRAIARHNAACLRVCVASSPLSPFLICSVLDLSHSLILSKSVSSSVPPPIYSHLHHHHTIADASVGLPPPLLPLRLNNIMAMHTRQRNRRPALEAPLRWAAATTAAVRARGRSHRQSETDTASTPAAGAAAATATSAGPTPRLSNRQRAWRRRRAAVSDWSDSDSEWVDSDVSGVARSDRAGSEPAGAGSASAARSARRGGGDREELNAVLPDADVC